AGRLPARGRPRPRSRRSVRRADGSGRLDLDVRRGDAPRRGETGQHLAVPARCAVGRARPGRESPVLYLRRVETREGMVSVMQPFAPYLDRVLVSEEEIKAHVAR